MPTISAAVSEGVSGRSVSTTLTRRATSAALIVVMSLPEMVTVPAMGG